MIKLAIVGGVIIAGAVLGVSALQSYLGPDDLKDCAKPDRLSSRCEPADAIVAISGGDTQARTDEAIKLYKAGWAPRLIFSGAARDTSGPSNAEAMREQALEAGVPNKAIWMDSSARDTVGNAMGTYRLLTGADSRIILVTSPYHQRRASLEFRHVLGDNIKIVNHPTPTDRNWGPYWWTTPHGWWLGLSELTMSLVISSWH